MVSCQKFKAEVFSSLMTSLIGLSLSMASIITNEWVKGTAVPFDTEEPGTINVNFGLFNGKKEESRYGIVLTQLSVVCTDGVCMLSCGGKSDLEDIISDSQTGDTSDGDQLFCDNANINQDMTLMKRLRRSPSLDYDSLELMRSASLVTESLRVFGRSTKHAGSKEIMPKAKLEDYKSVLLRSGMLNSVLAFLGIALVFCLVNLIFTVVNIAHNPISSIFGIDGLVVWNSTIALSYLLVLILWGTEFASRLSSNLCISETLRVEGVQWSTNNSQLGYSYWLLLPNMFLHIINAVVLGYRQYKRYYSSASKQSKSLEMKVQETTEGKDMLY